MKKLLASILCLALCLTLTGCWELESGETPDFWELEPPVEETPEPEPTETPAPTGEVYAIDGVVYVDGVPIEGEAAEVPAS